MRRYCDSHGMDVLPACAWCNLALSINKLRGSMFKPLSETRCDSLPWFNVRIEFAVLSKTF